MSFKTGDMSEMEASLRRITIDWSSSGEPLRSTPLGDSPNARSKDYTNNSNNKQGVHH